MTSEPASKEISSDVCIVCCHKLTRLHIEEMYGWRCHSIATPDLLQCECYLRKGMFRVSISFYDMAERVEKAKKDPAYREIVLGE